MKKIIAVACSLLVTCCTGGCNKTTNATSAQTVTDAWSAGSIQEIHLKDGTRCAVLIGAAQGALDCEWKDHINHITR